jgi:RNA polymerase sigma-70 factor, ECF subfamily
LLIVRPAGSRIDPRVPGGHVKAEPKRARFQAAILPHLDRLVALASRWATGNEAEDHVQETYVRAWAAFEQLRDIDAAFPWLCQILRTVVGERRRTCARRQRLVFITELEAAHEEIVASDAPSPLDDLLARLEKGRLREALWSIPEDFAEAVDLHDVQGMKYREIAQITSVPIGTVMSRISRGRRLLAGLLVATGEKRAKGAWRREETSPRNNLERCDVAGIEDSDGEAGPAAERDVQ